MNWCPVILLVFAIAAPFTCADDTQSCGKAQINNVIKNVKTLINGEWENNGDTQDVILQKLGLKLKEILSTSENTVGHCTAEEKLEFQHALEFVSKMLAGETSPAEKALQLVEDDQVLDDFTKLICDVNCIYVAEFASQFKQPTSKIRIYQTLTNLLHDTKLEMKRIDTRPNLPLIKVLNTIAHQETDESVAVALKTLLRQAFTTELNMEFGNVDELYEMDTELTSEIMQQLIHEGIMAQEKCEETHTGILHVFQLIKSRHNLTLWLHNLELIFDEVKNTNKLNTINSVIFLTYYKEMQNDPDFAEAIKRWEEIVKELPVKAHKIASGVMCSQMDPYNKIKAYVHLNSREVEVQKLAPSDQNTKTAFNMFLTGVNVTLLVDYIPAADYKFDIPVEIEHGNLVPLPKEETSQATGYACQPFGGLFLDRDRVETCEIKKIIDSILNSA